MVKLPRTSVNFEDTQKSSSIQQADQSLMSLVQAIRIPKNTKNKYMQPSDIPKKFKSGGKVQN